MNDQQLLRYSRQILLPNFDIAGQETLLNARVLIIGIGGLGSPAALYLAAAGVGHLFLADFDVVDLSNLQRQIIHTQDRLGHNKAASAAAAIAALNPDVQVTQIPQQLTPDSVGDVIAQVDVVLDCSDNFSIRQAVNQACVSYGKPLVTGAAIRFEAQIAVFDSRQPDSPCYQCLYPSLPQQALSCSESGVISPLVGIVGSYQALEAIKTLTGVGENLCGRLQVFDGWTAEWRTLRLPKDPNCSVCHENHF